MRPALPSILALVASCAPTASSAPTALLFADHAGALAVAPDRWSIRRSGREVASVRVESVSLDRVEAAWHPGRALAAVVVHHGRRGGASLILAGDHGGSSRLAGPVHPGLSAPHWSPSGQQLALVRRLRPARVPTGPVGWRLQHRGVLRVIDVDSGESRDVSALRDVARVVGWQRDGRALVVTRHTAGDLPGERLARVALADGSVEALGVDDGAPSLLYDVEALVDGTLSFLRTDRPLVTAPARGQRLERIRGRLAPSGGLVRLAASGIRADRVALDPPSPSPPYLPAPSGLAAPAALIEAFEVPYVHQVYDVPDGFDGSWACGPTSTLMAVVAFGRLPKLTIQVSQPAAHSSDYGAYVSEQYDAFGSTFDRSQNDASGKPARGAYGWCTDDGLGWAWRMQDYAKRHELSADFSDTATFAGVKAALDGGELVVLSTKLTSGGHLITVIGTTADGKLVANDPYGDRNQPSYPNPDGAGAIYTWAQVNARWMITVHGERRSTGPELAATVKTLDHPASVRSGERATVSLTLTNVGQASWDGSIELATTGPRDRSSELVVEGGWLAANRVMALPATAPGEDATLTFEIAAPFVCERRELVERFGLVGRGEGGGWFADDGGPPDEGIAIAITVEPVDADGDGHDACNDCDDDDPTRAADCHAGDDPPCTDGEDCPLVPQQQTRHQDLHGGCALGGRAETGPLALVLLVLLALRRRRRGG